MEVIFVSGDCVIRQVWKTLQAHFLSFFKVKFVFIRFSYHKGDTCSFRNVETYKEKYKHYLSSQHLFFLNTVDILLPLFPTASGSCDVVCLTVWMVFLVVSLFCGSAIRSVVLVRHRQC